MSKKTRRQRRKTSRTRVAPAPTAETTSKATAAPTAAKPTAATRASASSAVDLAQEYHYVFTDLRKIAIIAVVMFALLFALAFVLR